MFPPADGHALRRYVLLQAHGRAFHVPSGHAQQTAVGFHQVAPQLVSWGRNWEPGAKWECYDIWWYVMATNSNYSSWTCNLKPEHTVSFFYSCMCDSTCFHHHSWSLQICSDDHPKHSGLWGKSQRTSRSSTTCSMGELRCHIGLSEK